MVMSSPDARVLSAARMRATLLVVALTISSSASAAPLTLPTLGLALDAPADAKIDANPHHDYVAVSAKTLQLHVAKASDVANTKLEDEVHSIKLTMQPTDLASETLPDGFIIRYTTMMGDKKRYMLKGYRSIAGTGYSCDIGADTSAMIASAAAACKSLRK
jgi:hypothetical protein